MKSAEDTPPVFFSKAALDGGIDTLRVIDWSPTREQIAIGAYEGSIILWNPQSATKVRRERAHEASVSTLAWSFDGAWLASIDTDRKFRLWNVQLDKAFAIAEVNSLKPVQLAWSPCSHLFAIIASDGSLHIYNAKTKKSFWKAVPRIPPCTAVAWIPNEKNLVVGCADKSVRVIGLDRTNVGAIFRGHESAITSVEADPLGRFICSGSNESSIRVWELASARLKYVLEGHSDRIIALSFSSDGKLLMSHSRDSTVRLWHAETWKAIGTIQERCIDPTTLRRIGFCRANGLSETFAILSEASNSLRILAVNSDSLKKQLKKTSTIYYTNTKVVLVGDSGAGKTGLSLVLTKNSFRATESTHARQVLVFEQQENRDAQGQKEIREIFLWDLAGQPGYRMTHQLHLDDVNVALIVFDSKNDGDVFGGVKHWARALRVAERFRDPQAARLKKLLVAARSDRGGPAVSRDRIDGLVKELGFDGYFETSAKEDWNIAELRDAIREAIDWEEMARVSWQNFFLKVKDFVLSQKSGGRLVCLQSELFQNFLQSTREHGEIDVAAEFNTCVERLGNQDIIRKLSFGGLILLRPEILDAYASAIVISAYEEPDGTGSIPEQDVYAGRFKMNKDERLRNKDDEKLLLLATVEELLNHEIALRESSEDGAHFVFPSQFTRERPTSTVSKLVRTGIFTFQGPLQNIYATLAVRFCHSGFFEKDQMWKNSANFRARDGGLCGIYVREVDEGYGELIVFFGRDVSEQSRYVFTEYIHAHLSRRSVPGTVTYQPVVMCQSCSFVVTEQLVSLRTERGFDWVSCPVCATRVSLVPESRVEEIPPDEISALERNADLMRDKLVGEIIVESKKKIQEFDVFLAHKSVDKSLIVKLANALRERGINPWLDKEQIPPGRWFQDVIQAAIPTVKAAAICIGTSGLGQWQHVELRSFISECVERRIPVIPVLLPGVRAIPNELRFLREFNWVEFTKTVNESDALDNLAWGITGRRPSSPGDARGLVAGAV